MKTPIAHAVALAVAVTLGAADPPVATTTSGSVRGAALTAGGAVFKGVPFAQPPVGSLRWREPQPVPKWSDTRDATGFAPPCAQSGQLRAELAPIGREDCLYLNVW